MNLNRLTPFLVLVILALSFLWWGTCQSNKVDRLKAENESRINLERIQELEAKAHKADSLANEIRKQRTTAMVKDSVEIRGLKSRIARLKGMDIVWVNKDADFVFPTEWSIVDTLGHEWHGSQKEFEQWVFKGLLKDSIIQAQDTLILKLELRYDATVISYEAELKERVNQIFATQAQKDLWRQSAESAQKDVRKEVRRKTFWKITSGILAGGIVYLSLQR